MCGLAALFQPARSFDPALAEAMAADLLHRGPDAGATLTEPGLALAFRRLSILDERALADQPMTDASGRYSLVFNGEIYNYRSLRQELEGHGVRFRTTGDTEVLLQGFARWGEAVLDQLVGMYAFVIVDRETRRAVAARDPFGIKPLYMLQRGGLTGFASEMRPLCRLTEVRPDPQALRELLLFRFAAGRLSNLSGIDRIPGGTLIEVDLDDGAVRERRFYDVLDTLAPTASADRNAALGAIDEALEQSVTDHLASDVGYAVQLSGGIDSSLVTQLAAQHTDRPLRSFGIRLEDPRHDEGAYQLQAAAAAGSVHEEVFIGGHEVADALPRAVRHMEGPSPHFGCILLMLLCDRIRAHTKVVLTGEGADEMFGGYGRYGVWPSLRRHRAIANLLPATVWEHLPRLRHYAFHARYDPAIYATVPHDLFALLPLFPELQPVAGHRERVAARFSDFRDRLFAVDQSAYLESLLLRQDKMAMAASVEARVPFTHVPLATVVNRLPHRLRAPGGVTKPLLKAIAERHFTSEFVHRRKVGLSLPFADWLLDEAGLGRYLEALTENSCRLAHYAQPGALRDLVDRFRGGEHGLGRRLAHLVNVELWLRTLPTGGGPVGGANDAAA